MGAVSEQSVNTEHEIELRGLHIGQGDGFCHIVVHEYRQRDSGQ